MSWRDPNVKLESMTGVGANARFKDDDDTFEDDDEDVDLDASLFGDDDVSDAGDAVGDDEDSTYEWIDEPWSAAQHSINEEVRTLVFQQEFCHLIVLYRRASSRNDMVDILGSSRGRGGFPYYCPQDMPLASADELMEEVHPLPVDETWIFAEFVQEFRRIHQAVRDEVQERKGDVLATLYRDAPGHSIHWFNSVIDSYIMERLIREGDNLEQVGA